MFQLVRTHEARLGNGVRGAHNHQTLKNALCMGREATSSVRGRDNVKDLGRLNRDLARVVLVDDNAWSFLLQPANGVPAVPYLGSPHDG